MPSLETADGKPVDVTPPSPDEVNRQFQAAMNDDGPDDKAPPKRARVQPVGEPLNPPRRPGKPRTTKAEKARTTAAAAVQLSDAQRSQGVQGLAQLGAGLFLMVGKATKKDAYVADAITVASKADEIADACVQTAHADARFAAALDRVCSAGPYAAMISVGVGLVSQIARNHGAQVPGTIDPAEMLKAQAEAEAGHVAAAA